MANAVCDLPGNQTQPGSVYALNDAMVDRSSAPLNSRIPGHQHGQIGEAAG